MHSGSPICIFGLTADPMTVAHREMCRMVMDNFFLHKLYVIPTVVNYHREGKEYWLSDEERVESCRSMLATLGARYESKWRVLDDEIRLKHLCQSECSDELNAEVISNRRFVHTLLDFIIRYGSTRDIVLVLGTDSYEHLRNWHQYKDILALISRIIVFQGRDGLGHHSTLDESLTVWNVNIPSKLANVSASKVRERYVKSGKTLAHYLDDVSKLDKGRTSLEELGWS